MLCVNMTLLLKAWALLKLPVYEPCQQQAACARGSCEEEMLRGGWWAEQEEKRKGAQDLFQFDAESDPQS